MTRNRFALVGVSVIAAAIVAAIVLLITKQGDSHSTPVASQPRSSAVSSSGSSSTSPFPAIPPPPTDSGGTTSGSAAASGAPVSQEQARSTVVSYVDDVNQKDRVSAGKLICAELYDRWLQNIDAANSDFNYVITNARFIGSDAIANGGRVAHYALTFNDNSTSNVDFTLVDESGPKICGESHV